MGRETARTFQDLRVWEKAHGLVLAIYGFSRGFPSCETYGLQSQIRRAAVSIPANIAEGFKRRTKGDKVRFLNIAQGSLEEVRYFLILSKDLGYGDCHAPMSRLEEVGRLLEVYTTKIDHSR